MYMRLLTIELKPWASSQIREFYEQRVLPGLQETEGCLYATLTARGRSAVRTKNRVQLPTFVSI